MGEPASDLPPLEYCFTVLVQALLVRGLSTVVWQRLRQVHSPELAPLLWWLRSSASLTLVFVVLEAVSAASLTYAVLQSFSSWSQLWVPCPGSQEEGMLPVPSIYGWSTSLIFLLRPPSAATTAFDGVAFALVGADGGRASGLSAALFGTAEAAFDGPASGMFGTAHSTAGPNGGRGSGGVLGAQAASEWEVPGQHGNQWDTHDDATICVSHLPAMAVLASLIAGAIAAAAAVGTAARTLRVSPRPATMRPSLVRALDSALLRALSLALPATALSLLVWVLAARPFVGALQQISWRLQGVDCRLSVASVADASPLGLLLDAVWLPVVALAVTLGLLSHSLTGAAHDAVMTAPLRFSLLLAGVPGSGQPRADPRSASFVATGLPAEDAAALRQRNAALATRAEAAARADGFERRSGERAFLPYNPSAPWAGAGPRLHDVLAAGVCNGQMDETSLRLVGITTHPRRSVVQFISHWQPWQGVAQVPPPAAFEPGSSGPPLRKDSWPSPRVDDVPASGEAWLGRWAQRHTAATASLYGSDVTIGGAEPLAPWLGLARDLAFADTAEALVGSAEQRWAVLSDASGRRQSAILWALMAPIDAVAVGALAASEALLAPAHAVFKTDRARRGGSRVCSGLVSELLPFDPVTYQARLLLHAPTRSMLKRADKLRDAAIRSGKAPGSSVPSVADVWRGASRAGADRPSWRRGAASGWSQGQGGRGGVPDSIPLSGDPSASRLGRVVDGLAEVADAGEGWARASVVRTGKRAAAALGAVAGGTAVATSGVRALFRKAFSSGKRGGASSAGAASSSSSPTSSRICLSFLSCGIVGGVELSGPAGSCDAVAGALSDLIGALSGAWGLSAPLAAVGVAVQRVTPWPVMAPLWALYALVCAPRRRLGCFCCVSTKESQPCAWVQRLAEGVADTIKQDGYSALHGHASEADGSAADATDLSDSGRAAFAAELQATSATDLTTQAAEAAAELWSAGGSWDGAHSQGQASLWGTASALLRQSRTSAAGSVAAGGDASLLGGAGWGLRGGARGSAGGLAGAGAGAHADADADAVARGDSGAAAGAEQEDDGPKGVWASPRVALATGAAEAVLTEQAHAPCPRRGDAGRPQCAGRRLRGHGLAASAAAALAARRSVDDEVEAVLWDSTAFIASCDALAALAAADASGEAGARRVVRTAAPALLTCLLEAHISLRRMCLSPWFRASGAPVSDTQGYALLLARETPLRMLQASHSAVFALARAFAPDLAELPLRWRHRDALQRMLEEADESLTLVVDGVPRTVNGADLLWAPVRFSLRRPVGMLSPPAAAEDAVGALEGWAIAALRRLAQARRTAAEAAEDELHEQNMLASRGPADAPGPHADRADNADGADSTDGADEAEGAGEGVGSSRRSPPRASSSARRRRLSPRAPSPVERTAPRSDAEELQSPAGTGPADGRSPLRGVFDEDGWGDSAFEAAWH
ncbi:hypothetical protein FNF31_07097 [Cafeteria roenbergensis]|uniref:Uncharacterized protein n=2 Tax=Cafeteria roenbergensis TaxID=33653 RepID=A0A5A8C512_CAFRO|nr:hypothetical protein FNF28_07541 [Cafeteria roenbergensis]KAA0150011.1 hypothetical protein FNF31_07097 [Cafeteria roenbergensis]